MLYSKKSSLSPVAALILGCLLLATTSFAIGSGKSDEEKADEKKTKAIEVYDDGVMYLEKARFTAELGDSAFAFNYRATSDAKAKKAFEKAVDRFKEATKLDPTMKEAFNNLGYAYRKLGKLDESLAAYQSALALDSSFAQAREYLGETYLALDQLDKAEEQYQWLLSIESPYADTLSGAINMYKLREINAKLKDK